MSNESIDTILGGVLHRGLPTGFAERMADLAMGVTPEARYSIWDMLVRLSPRFTIAAGVIATAVLFLALSGDGPTMFQAISQYATVESYFPLP